MVIIGCGYKKKSGKDTFFQIVKKLYPNKNIQRVAFADELKNEVYDHFLMSIDLEKKVLDDPKYKDSIRPLMQGWGNLRREFFHPDYWIKIAFDKLENDFNELENDIDKDNTIYIFTDCRYPNEIDYLKSKKGITVNIKRDSVVDNKETHISETALDSHLDKFDFTIDNNGTIEEYEQSIKEFMDLILSTEFNVNFR